MNTCILSLALAVAAILPSGPFGVLAAAVRCQEPAQKEKLLNSVRVFVQLAATNWVRPAGGVGNGLWRDSDKEWWRSTGIFASLDFPLYAERLSPGGIDRHSKQAPHAVAAPVPAAGTSAGWRIVSSETSAQITAGILTRNIRFDNGNATTSRLSLGDCECMAGAAREVSLTVTRAKPNRKPKGLSLEQAPTVETSAHFAPEADSMAAGSSYDSGVNWVEPLRIEGRSWSALFERPDCRVSQPTACTQRLTIHTRAKNTEALGGLELSLHYEIYEGYPVIRKWVEITQRGTNWVKLEKLILDDLELVASFRQRTSLTPGERGAGASVAALGDPNGECGLIAVSEIPSALRQMHDSGAMGDSESWFEWVLGPGETFVSEPVFHFAWQGTVTPTVSGISTPLDRAVEGPYQEFLRQHVGVAADRRKICAPQWCSWTHFYVNLDDALVREQAKIAARCGFALLLLDQGWQKGLVGTEPDPKKFPDFAATCRYLRSLGLEIGLWVSSFRSEDSPDMKAMPGARNLPLLHNSYGGYGMSFASPWSRFCAEDLAAVSRRFGVRYFKQDFTNIKFGDAAEGHASRTRKESLLRGLRGLLETQDLLRKAAPDVTAEFTHEIYWGTPGVPCDVAAVKHASAYHIPPNDYAGAGPKNARVRQDKPIRIERLRKELQEGCFHARQRFYEHRGLPLYTLEYYAAHAVNIRGSLTPAIQDRQICSWLMGVPAVFAGDLASLTQANIAHYRRRFDLVKRLERDYGIFRRFQFSGVPTPTDHDWHWWGKLTPEGCGAVVVLRGAQGAGERAVNIPWVLADRNYRVSTLLSGKALGTFTGRQLQAGEMRLTLPPLGQEILEVKTEP